MKNQTLQELAQSHAIEILGEGQFTKNKQAAKSIMLDFKAGYKAAEKALKPHIITAKQRWSYERMRGALITVCKFQTPEQLQRNSEKEYGLQSHEAIEMSYENMQMIAKAGVKGVKALK